MKRLKKLSSMLLTVVMLLGVSGIPAYAASTHTMTITSETSGHTYQAYQVFAGTYSENSAGEKILSNVTWGSGVNGGGLLSALKSDATYGSAFASCTTAADTATAISGITDSGFGDAFAAIVVDYLTATHSDSGTPTGSGPYTYTISGLPDGYYFVDEAAFSSNPTNNAYTKYILQVLGDVTVSAKTDTPAIAKKVFENNDPTYAGTWNDAADYSMGSAVPFRLVGLVPNMSNYQTYYYQITDTLSTALSFNSNSVKVYFVSSGAMYNVETSASTGAGGTLIPSTAYKLQSAGNGFSLTFDDLKSVAGVSDNGYIVVEYNATLTTDAVIGNPGNPNEVYLTYSNNPNNSGLGTTDHGQTPKDEVVVFTFALPVSKVDTAHAALTGATFALFANQSDAAAAASNPSAANLAKAFTFTGSDGTYALDSKGTTSVLAGDSSGAYAIKGLDQGTYYLVEVNEPTGYNRLLEPVSVAIVSSYNATQYVDGHIPDATNDQLKGSTVNGGSKLTVINQAGFSLPITGGVGTVIFIAGGLVLIAGACALLIMKRKMKGRQ